MSHFFGQYIGGTWQRAFDDPRRRGHIYFMSEDQMRALADRAGLVVNQIVSDHGAFNAVTGGRDLIGFLEKRPSRLEGHDPATVSLLKSAGDDRIYAVIGGERLTISYAGQFERAGFRWDRVREVSDAELAAVPDGGSLELWSNVLDPAPSAVASFGRSMSTTASPVVREPVTTQQGPPSVSISGVTKAFRLPHQRYHTLKERALHPFRANSYDVLQAVDDVDVEIAPGEFFGIVGRNGSGKSTLLKCIAGIYDIDARRDHRARAAVAVHRARRRLQHGPHRARQRHHQRDHARPHAAAGPGALRRRSSSSPSCRTSSTCG